MYIAGADAYDRTFAKFAGDTIEHINTNSARPNLTGEKTDWRRVCRLRFRQDLTTFAQVDIDVAVTFLPRDAAVLTRYMMIVLYVFVRHNWTRPMSKRVSTSLHE